MQLIDLQIVDVTTGRKSKVTGLAREEALWLVRKVRQNRSARPCLVQKIKGGFQVIQQKDVTWKPQGARKPKLVSVWVPIFIVTERKPTLWDRLWPRAA